MLNQDKPTLYLIRGISGSGKSNLAAEMSNAMRIEKYEADDYFYTDEGEYEFDHRFLGEAHAQCERRAMVCLSTRNSCIVSNSSCTEREVKTYKHIAENYDANFVSIVVENRNNTSSIHDVPEDVLRNQRKKFSVKL